MTFEIREIRPPDGPIPVFQFIAVDLRLNCALVDQLGDFKRRPIAV